MSNTEKNNSRSALEILISLVVCTMLGSLMFISDIIMEFLPNIHIVGVLVVIYTIAYRSRALISIYVYAFVNGLVSGFGIWWIGYLYIWTILWALVMLVPRGLGDRIKSVIYVAIVTLHGFAFGLLYLPVQTFFSTDPAYLFSWWAIGFVTADIYHGIANCIFGILLIAPLSKVLRKLNASLIMIE